MTNPSDLNLDADTGTTGGTGADASSVSPVPALHPFDRASEAFSLGDGEPPTVNRVRRMVLGGVAIALLVALASGVSGVVLFQSAVWHGREAHTLGNIGFLLNRLLIEVTDTETGQRGFLITSDPAYLQPFEASKSQVGVTLQELQSALAEQPERTKLPDVQMTVGAKLSELEETIALVKQGQSGEAVNVVKTDRGKRIMDNLRAQVVETVTSLRERRATHVKAFTQQSTIAMIVGVVGTASVFAILAGFGAIMHRELTLREKAELEAHRQQVQRLAAERAARSAAERNVHLQGEFVATLSHELRTPLNSILGWAQLLKRPEHADTELGQGLETIERNARVQSQLIEDLLDTSRIVEGKIRLDVQRVNPAKIVELVIESVHPTAAAKGVRLETTLDPRTNVINGDPSRLQQIIWNLVSNAVKFTPKGGKVQVSVRRSNSSVLIEVSDTGKGIKPEFLPHVFERFKQADSSMTRRFGGLGLGLSIAKQLTELHGGVIEAHSEGEGKGSTFTIQLPLVIMHGASAPERRRPQDQPVTPKATPLKEIGVRLDGVRVLVVDDERDSREMLDAVLRRAGADTRAAGGAAEALAILPSFRPNVLVSDIGMPDVDGLELLRRVRQLPESQGGRTPAIALTALARSHDRTQALLAGFQVHAAKPIEPSEIIAQVAGVARLSGVSTNPTGALGRESAAS